LNRRDFLKSLFATAAVAATPKLIFDLGANTYRRDPMLDWRWVIPNPAYETAEFEEIFIRGKLPDEFRLEQYPKRYTINEAGVFIPVSPFL